MNDAAKEMLENIQIMVLNRIDELKDQLDKVPADNNLDFLARLDRLNEAKYIFATCLDPRWFVPRRPSAI